MKKEEKYYWDSRGNESFTITKDAVDRLAKWLLKVIFIYTPITIAALGVLLYILYRLLE
ncbi:MAG: hypothetical protein LBF67_08155 [Prevotellaceae bacterium]|jgi:hypothetical protein|nr:hypothetical protein [Prevotellaceae bacterium]